MTSESERVAALEAEAAQLRQHVALLEQELELHRSIVQDQTEFVCRFRPDGTLTFMNDAYLRYFGHSAAELIGQNFLPHVPEPDQTALRQVIDNLSLSHPVHVSEQRVLLPNSEIRWTQWTDRAIFDTTGKVAEIQAVGRDITERKNAEQEQARLYRELHESQSLLQTILDNSPLSIYVLDQHERLLLINRSMAQFALDPERVTPGAGLDAFPLETQQRWRRQCQQVFQSGQPLETEFHLQRNGQQYIYLSYKFALRNAQHERYAVCCIATDITDIRRAQEARTREIEQAAILEERNRLARDLHDSATQALASLTLIAEGCRSLARDGRLDNVDQHFARVGEIASEALAELRLLVYQLRAPALEEKGLVKVLRERLEAVERRSGIAAHLISQNLDPLPRPIAEQLYWIIREALNNTLKHAQATSLQISLESYVDQQHQNAHQPTRFVRVQVVDNGRGFEPEQVHKGLGLKNMDERAAALNGCLTVRAAPDAGTTVLVEVPLTPTMEPDNG